MAVVEQRRAKAQDHDWVACFRYRGRGLNLDLNEVAPCGDSVFSYLSRRLTTP
jgi:hypothetical protein